MVTITESSINIETIDYRQYPFYPSARDMEHLRSDLLKFIVGCEKINSKIKMAVNTIRPSETGPYIVPVPTNSMGFGGRFGFYTLVEKFYRYQKLLGGASAPGLETITFSTKDFYTEVGWVNTLRKALLFGWVFRFYIGTNKKNAYWRITPTGIAAYTAVKPYICETTGRLLNKKVIIPVPVAPIYAYWRLHVYTNGRTGIFPPFVVKNCPNIFKIGL